MSYLIFIIIIVLAYALTKVLSLNEKVRQLEYNYAKKIKELESKIDQLIRPGSKKKLPEDTTKTKEKPIEQKIVIPAITREVIEKKKPVLIKEKNEESSKSLFRNLIESFSEKGIGILGAIVIVLGIGYLAIYGYFKFAPLYKFLILNVIAIIFLVPALMLKKNQKWATFSLWLKGIAGALILFAMLSAGYITGLDFAKNTIWANVLLTIGIVFNLFLSYRSEFEIESIFHTSITLVALSILPLELFVLLITVVIVLTSLFFHIKKNWLWHQFAILLSFYSFHWLWATEQELHDELKYFGLACLLIISSTGTFLHYKLQWSIKHNFEKKPGLTGNKDAVESYSFLLRGFLHLSTWLMIGISFTLYSTGTILSTYVLFTLSGILAALSYFSYNKKANFLMKADALLAQIIFVVALLSLHKWNVSLISISFILIWQILAILLLSLQFRLKWLFSNLRLFFYLTSAMQIIYILQLSNLFVQPLDKLVNTDNYLTIGQVYLVATHCLILFIGYLKITFSKKQFVQSKFTLSLFPNKKNRINFFEDALFLSIQAIWIIFLYAWFLHNFSNNLLNIHYTFFATTLIVGCIGYFMSKVKGAFAPLLAIHVYSHLYLVSFSANSNTSKILLFLLPLLIINIVSSGIFSIIINSLQKKSSPNEANPRNIAVTLRIIPALLLTFVLYFVNFHIIKQWQPLLLPLSLMFSTLLFIFPASYAKNLNLNDKSNKTIFYFVYLGYVFIAFFIAWQLFDKQENLLFGSSTNWSVFSNHLIEFLAIHLILLPYIINIQKIKTRSQSKVIFYYAEVVIILLTLFSFTSFKVIYFPVVFSCFALYLFLLSYAPPKYQLYKASFYSFLLYLIANFFLATLFFFQKTEHTQWYQKDWFYGSISLPFLLTYIILAMKKWFHDNTPDIIWLKKNILQSKDISGMFIYPLVIAMAIFLSQTFTSTVLTLFWVGESFLIFGLALILRQEHYRIVSMVALFTCLFRLVFFDLAASQTAIKAVVLVAVGSIMLLMNLLYTKYKERLDG